MKKPKCVYDISIWIRSSQHVTQQWFSMGTPLTYSLWRDEVPPVISLKRSQRVARSAPVCVSAVRLQYRWVRRWWTRILKDTARALLYLMQRARSSAKFTLLRNKKANPVREKISIVTLLSRESLSSFLALFRSLSLFCIFCCIADVVKGLHLKKLKKKHTQGKSVKKIKAWLTHTVGFYININPPPPPHPPR